MKGDSFWRFSSIQSRLPWPSNRPGSQYEFAATDLRDLDGQTEKDAVLGGILIFVAVAVISLSMLPMRGTGDVALFLKYVANVRETGPVTAYKAATDVYPPGFFIQLRGVGDLAKLAGTSDFVAYKAVTFVSLLLSAWMLVAMFGSWAVGSLFLAATALESVWLGYFDIWLTPLLIGCLWLFKLDRPLAALVAFTVAGLIKWQALIIAPPLVLYALRISDLTSALSALRERRIFIYGTVVGAVFIPFIAIFRSEVVLTWVRIFEHGRRSLVANATNLPMIVSFFWNALNGFQITWTAALPAPPRLFDHRWIYLSLRGALIASQLFVTIVGLRLCQTLVGFLFVSVVWFWSYYILSTGVHENHLFLAIVLAIVLYGFNRKYWVVLVLTVVAVNGNLILFYVLPRVGLSILLFSISCVVGYVWLMHRLWQEYALSKPLADWHCARVSRLDREAERPPVVANAGD